VSATGGRALLLAGALLLGGCAQRFDATTLGVPATMAGRAGEPAQGQPFSVTTRAVYGLWGLATIRQPSLERALARQLVGGSGVADLRIKVRSKWSDVLVTVLTAGLIAPRAVTFEGVVTGAPEQAPAQAPAQAAPAPAAPAPATPAPLAPDTTAVPDTAAAPAPFAPDTAGPVVPMPDSTAAPAPAPADTTAP
jgi:hypothetical protein